MSTRLHARVSSERPLPRPAFAHQADHIVCASPCAQGVVYGTFRGDIWLWPLTGEPRPFTGAEQAGARRMQALTGIANRVLVVTSPWIHATRPVARVEGEPRLLLLATDTLERAWDRLFPGSITATLEDAPQGRIVAGDDRGKLVLLDADSGAVLAEQQAHDGQVTALEQLDEAYVSCGADGRVRLWASDLSPKASLEGHRGEATALAVAHDAPWFVSGGRDRTWLAWDRSSLEVVHRGQVASAITSLWLLDPSMLIVVERKGTISRWELRSSRLTAETRPLCPHGHVKPLAGGRSISWTEEASVVVANPTTLEVSSAFGRGDYAHDHAIDEARDLVVAWGQNSIACWSLSGDTLDLPRHHLGSIVDVAGDVRGERVVSLTMYGELKCWSPASGQLLWSARTDNRPHHLVQVSPDGGSLVTWSGEGEIQVWDATSGQRRLDLRAHDSWIVVVEWSPSGERLLSADGGEVGLWCRQTGNCLRRLKTYQSSSLVAFAGEGRFVAGGRQGEVALWDLTSGERIRTLAELGQPVSAISVDAAGQNALIGGWNGKLVEVDLESGQQRTLSEGVLRRVLSLERFEGRVLARDDWGRSLLLDATSGDVLLNTSPHDEPRDEPPAEPAQGQPRAIFPEADGCSIRELVTGKIVARYPLGQRPVQVKTLGGGRYVACSEGRLFFLSETAPDEPP